MTLSSERAQSGGGRSPDCGGDDSPYTLTVGGHDYSGLDKSTVMRWIKDGRAGGSAACVSQSGRAGPLSSFPEFELGGACSTEGKADTFSAETESVFCQNCGQKNRGDDLRCLHCGYYLHSIPAPQGIFSGHEGAAIRMIIPVNCSGWALLCGYLGLMSFLVLPAPFAVIAGLIAVWDIRRNPHKEGMNRVVFGFVMAVMGPLFTLPIICR